MSINLDKYRDELVSAWRDVLDNKTTTDWALFAYEGQTNILKFISKGSEGLEELAEDLNSGKIMYAFCKVTDSKTSLDKFILLNWQGEGANTMRKGISANHLRDIEKFFTGANLTISARNEDEVEPQLILDKVAKAGSAYSFKSVKTEVIEPTGPVGTAYKRVNPGKEINSMERDQFWKKEEEEEKRRVEEEKRRRDDEKSKIEEEVRRREALASAKQEEESKLYKEEERATREAVEQARKLAMVREIKEDAHTEVRVNQSDVLRKERKREAEELISQRTVDCKAIFEQNTYASQLKKVPEKPVRNSILKAQAQAMQHTNNHFEKTEIPQQGIVQHAHQEETISDDDSDQFSTIKRSPKDPEKKTSPPNNLQFEQKTTEVKQQQNNQMTVENLVDELIYDFNSPGIQAKALYDYQAADDTEITFDPGDVITNIDQVDEGWWQGLAPNGSYGLFPANYVELL